MANQISLNDKVYHMSESDLPCLIHYAPKAGGSHFSVAMVVDLFQRGSKILFFTAYPMAKDNFIEQTKGMESKIAVVMNESQLNSNTQAIILESGNEKLFLKAVEKLEDLSERIILVKNIEVFSNAILERCLTFQKIILSGNLDECSIKKKISEKKYKTIVLFSDSKNMFNVIPPMLEKYTGYLWGNGKEGRVRIQKNKQ